MDTVIKRDEFAVIVDGSAGSQSRIIERLKRDGYNIVDDSKKQTSKINNSEYIEPTIAVYVWVSTKWNKRSNIQLQKLIEKYIDTQFIILAPILHTSVIKQQHQENRIWVLPNESSIEDILVLVAKACVVWELEEENRQLHAVVGEAGPLQALPFRSAKMAQLDKQVFKLTNLSSTILILGETGSGKSTLARLIHNRSTRRDRPFITVSCGAMPRELMESELFGHEKGAFTGAITSRPGSVELAEGGTLFLDEIGDLPLELQPKLLTFLQERWTRRVGGNLSRTSDVRIIAATNRDLSKMLKEKQFREDLLFRLSVITIEVPSLRERREDIEKIASDFIARLAQRQGSRMPIVTSEAMQRLREYDWPGNVRELENVLEAAFAFSLDGKIEVSDLKIIGSKSRASFVPRSMAEIEREALLLTLQCCDWNKERAAEILQISLKSVYNLINKYKLREEQ